MIESATALIAYAKELDDLSKSLLECEQRLSLLEVELATWVEDQHVAMYKRSLEEEDYKLPSESIRSALAHKSFDPDKYQRFLGLRAQRSRGKQRLSDLREIVAAHRSLVSAAKTELEATEGPQPQWTPAGG